MNRSIYYKQIAIFTLIISVICIFLDQLLLEIIVYSIYPHKIALVCAQILIFPILLMLFAPYAGRNKNPETKSDIIKKYGYDGFMQEMRKQKRKTRDEKYKNNRRRR